MKKINYPYLFCFVSWLILLFLRIYEIIPHEMISQISAKMEFIIHLFMVPLSIVLYKNAEIQNKKILFLLIPININLFLNDMIFYLLIYFSNNYSFNFFLNNFVLNFIPYSIWIISAIIFPLYILKDLFNSNNFMKLFSILMLINMLMIMLFFYSVPSSFEFFSWQHLSQIISSLAELIIYNLCILCLIYSENRGLSFIVIGLIVLISGDFIISYSFLAQTSFIATYGELFWLLGMLCIFFGMLELKNQRSAIWLRSINAIKSRLAFWAFGISIINILPFFILAYCFTSFNKTVFLACPPFLMLTSVLIVLVSLLTAKYFEIPFKKITNNIEFLMTNDNITEYDHQFIIEEFVYLQEFILKVIKVMEEREAAKKALGTLAAQVAHDMRSPLLAVDSFFCLVEKKLEEHERVFGRRAIRRLDDLVWSLLYRYKNKSDSDHNAEDNYVYLSSCIQELLSEKRMEYAKQNIEFEFMASEKDVFSLVYLSSITLKRMLSNLINNAVNAKSTMVEISLETNIAGALIAIKDNGCGMNPRFIKEVLANAKSEKAKTNLGLPHAIKFLEQIGGQLDITSSVGEGTETCISLPPCKMPNWCLKEYQIRNNEWLVIIDDSQSVHDVWDEMFKKLHHVEYQHFYNPNEAILFFETTTNKNLVIFCDYDFFDEEQNGLDILELAPTGSTKVLVTSYLYNPSIMKKAIDKGLKILPKDLVPYFKLYSQEDLTLEKQISLIFIDDDLRNTQSWEFFAQAKNLKIVTYNNTQDFFANASSFKKDIPIYIDLDLSEDKDGIAYAKEIHMLEFEKIYISTGAIDINIKKSDYPWVTAILEKKFPFI